MAHFAQLDDNNVILNVIKVHDSCCLDNDGNESESVGIAFCQSIAGLDSRWIQTSYNSRIRKNFATIGSYYDPVLDAFIPKKFFDSWILDQATCKWKPPVPYPDTTESVFWDELSQQWLLTKDLVWDEDEQKWHSTTTTDNHV